MDYKYRAEKALRQARAYNAAAQFYRLLSATDKVDEYEEAAIERYEYAQSLLEAQIALNTRDD